jgi:hypothetical protein
MARLTSFEKGAIAVLLLMTAPHHSASGQRPQPLKPFNAKLAAEFSDLTSVRELPDGRLFLTDRIENRVFIANFQTNQVATVGRVGDGPREYRNVLPLFSLAGDSSVMPGLPNTRWTLFKGDSIVATIPAHDPMLAVVPFLYGTDRSGALLTIAEPSVGRRGSGSSSADSLYLVLVMRATNQVDTIGRLGTANTNLFGQVPTGQRGHRRFYSVVDHAVLAPDRWVAVIRGHPYRVDWRSPDGRWRQGSRTIDQPIAMDDRERKAYLERRAAAASTVTRGGNRRPGTQMRPAPITDWPAMIPPVTAGWPPMTTEDGLVVIRRTATSRQVGPLYDVVDRTGTRKRQISMPEGARILGFGRSSVYVVTADSDGIQRVSRHSWP